MSARFRQRKQASIIDGSFVPGAHQQRVAVHDLATNAWLGGDRDSGVGGQGGKGRIRA